MQVKCIWCGCRIDDDQPHLTTFGCISWLKNQLAELRTASLGLAEGAGDKLPDVRSDSRVVIRD